MLKTAKTSASHSFIPPSLYTSAPLPTIKLPQCASCCLTLFCIHFFLHLGRRKEEEEESHLAAIRSSVIKYCFLKNPIFLHMKQWGSDGVFDSECRFTRIRSETEMAKTGSVMEREQ